MQNVCSSPSLQSPLTNLKYYCDSSVYLHLGLCWETFGFWEMCLKPTVMMDSGRHQGWGLEPEGECECFKGDHLRGVLVKGGWGLLNPGCTAAGLGRD